jgi:hypothetical protein
VFGAAQPLTIKEIARNSRAQPAGAIVVRCDHRQSALLAAFSNGSFYRASVSDILSHPSPFDRFNSNSFDPPFFHAQLAFLFQTYKRLQQHELEVTQPNRR